MIDPKSRYFGLPNRELAPAEGPTVTYLARRFLPQPDSLASQGNISVLQSERDRLDLIANRTLRHSEQFWRIADANGAMNPFELTATPGRLLRVPAPQV